MCRSSTAFLPASSASCWVLPSSPRPLPSASQSLWANIYPLPRQAQAQGWAPQGQGQNWRLLGKGGGVRQPIIKMPAGGGGVHSGRGKLVGEGHCRGVREEATTGPLRWVWGGPHCADDRRLVSWHQSGLRTWAPALTLAAPSPSRPQPIPQLPPPPRNPALG